VALRRQFGPARLNLAMALADQGRFGEALAVTREGLRLTPGDPRLLYETGFILLRQGQHAEAVAVHRELVRLHPDSPRAHTALAATLWGQGLFSSHTVNQRETWDAAAAEARAAIKLGPDDELAHLVLGEILKRQRRHDEAIHELRQAVRLRPEFSLAHSLLGDVLLAKGSVDEAIAECREALRLFADNLVSRQALGDALKRQGKLAEALAEWKEGLRLHPGNLMLLIRLGGELEAKGDLDGAIAVYRDAFRYGDAFGLRPTNTNSTRLRRAYGERIRALLARGDVDGATAMLQDEFRDFPDREVLAGLIKALKARNNPEAAMAYFDALIRDRPRDLLSWLARAAYLVEVARLDEAAADLATAVRDWPREPRAWLERGRIEVMRGHPDEAAAAYARVLELSPAPGDPWRNLDEAGYYAVAVAESDVFDRLLGLLPGNRALLVARVDHLAGRREWKAAAEVLARLNALEPPDSVSLRLEADLRSWLGDVEGYRRVCRAMLERFGATSDPTIARRTLSSCLLRDDAIPERRGLALAPLLDPIRADPTLREDVWSRISEGLYEYRAGHHAAVFETLSPSSKVAASSSDEIPAALGCLIRSMSHARLGQIAEARQQLATAEAALKPAHFDPGTSGPTPSNWNDWLRFYTLRREAEGLLRDAASPGDPFGPGRR
jgi:tetratricopeptide (TPR) repeat protein